MHHFSACAMESNKFLMHCRGRGAVERLRSIVDLKRLPRGVIYTITSYYDDVNGVEKALSYVETKKPRSVPWVRFRFPGCFVEIPNGDRWFFKRTLELTEKVTTQGGWRRTPPPNLAHLTDILFASVDATLPVPFPVVDALEDGEIKE